MSTALAAQAPPADLVREVNAEHEACVRNYTLALEHAINCGNLLYEIRVRVPGGAWGRWLKEHFDGDERTARGYMQLANAYHQDPAGLIENAGGSVQAAVAYLSRQVAGAGLSFDGQQGAKVRDAKVVEERYSLTIDELDAFARFIGKVLDADEVRAWLSEHGIEAQA